MISVFQLINAPIPSNCFVFFDKAYGNNCIIVDPGSKDTNELITFLENQSLFPYYIFLTHEHFDHCWGVNELVERYNIPIVCSKACSEAIKSEKKNCSVFYDPKERFVITSKIICVESINYKLFLGDNEILFFATPGHTDAGICFTIDHNLFTGDTLIKEMRTVTKLPTGSAIKLHETIELLNNLKGKGYMVYPGHGVCFHLDDYNLNKAL